MKTFEIRENGNKFATIDATNATSALRKAAEEYPRRACDYNTEPGDETTVEWYAFEIDGDERDSATISVPGTGISGCVFSKPNAVDDCDALYDD